MGANVNVWVLIFGFRVDVWWWHDRGWWSCRRDDDGTAAHDSTRRRRLPSRYVSLHSPSGGDPFLMVWSLCSRDPYPQGTFSLYHPPAPRYVFVFKSIPHPQVMFLSPRVVPTVEVCTHCTQSNLCPHDMFSLHLPPREDPQ